MNRQFSEPADRQHTMAPRAAFRCHTGQTLFEISVMVTVLMVLAGALLPVMGDSIANARLVRARSDAAQIATALVNFQRDVGWLVYDGAILRVSNDSPVASHVVDVLVSNGVLPALADTVPASPSIHRLLPGRPGSSGRIALEPWTTLSHADALDAHVRFNGRGYPTEANGPGTGWNGPYLGSAVNADPWGHAYLVNSGFLRNLSTQLDARSACAVFVLSAGPNGIIETPFSQPIKNARAFGDDIVVRIQ